MPASHAIIFFVSWALSPDASGVWTASESMLLGCFFSRAQSAASPVLLHVFALLSHLSRPRDTFCDLLSWHIEPELRCLSHLQPKLLRWRHLHGLPRCLLRLFCGLINLAHKHSGRTRSNPACERHVSSLKAHQNSLRSKRMRRLEIYVYILCIYIACIYTNMYCV